MIGSGTPSNQSKAPFPKSMTFLLSATRQAAAMSLRENAHHSLWFGIRYKGANLRGVASVSRWLSVDARHERPGAMPPGGVCSTGGIVLAPDSNFPVTGFGHGPNERVCSVLNTEGAAPCYARFSLWLPNSSITTRECGVHQQFLFAKFRICACHELGDRINAITQSPMSSHRAWRADESAHRSSP
jgi:hypothetical protein